MKIDSDYKKWLKDELIVAYYIAKWDYSGLQISEGDLACCVLDTSVNSLRLQIRRFRSLLSIGDEWVGKEVYKSNIAILDLLENKTMTQVRSDVLKYLDENCCEDLKVQKEALSHNKKINKRGG